ncbi:MAG: 2-oxoacid:acceptor oxidoreductase family protein [Planctomycetota bacterium]|jgi:indolepyruvate ferredoxin oxidoreductase beta subunit
MTAHAESCFRLLLMGVGGQGVLTAARTLGEAAMASGLPVRVGQLHGLSQRGGSVESSVVIGPGHTGFVGAKQADVVVGLDPLEAQRALPRMSARTRVVLNRAPIAINSLTVQGLEYPSLEEILAAIGAVTEHVTVVDGMALAHAAGNPRALNVVMLGLLAGLDLLPLDAAALAAAVDARSPERHREINRRAFQLGSESAGREATGREPTNVNR